MWIALSAAISASATTALGEIDSGTTGSGMEKKAVSSAAAGKKRPT